MEDQETSQVATDDAFSLIDGSTSDDDFLLSSEVSEVDNTGINLGKGTRVNQPSDSAELQKHRHKGKCNLRKSLAWDSAFFTSAGVLDAEELSSIIEGTETSVKQKHFLRGIEEDLSKSTDSISTFQSDLTLESLEADLFCDIRASIQRSSKPTTMGDRNSSKIHGEREFRNGCAKKNVEPSSSSMAKPKVSSKKLNPGAQGPMKTFKPGSIPRQVPKPAVRSKESSLVLPRPSEAAGKPSLNGAAANKRISVGAGRVKSESNAAGNLKGKGALSSKVSSQADPKTTVPRMLAAAKVSSGSSVLSRAPLRGSRSSCDSSVSSSENTRKSQADIIRRKMDKNVNMPSVSKTKTPSRVAVKSKSRSGGSNLSDYLKSAPKLSSSVSPASSISEWSTESSCSTVTTNQKHLGVKTNLSASDDAFVDRNVPRNPQSHSSNGAFGEHANQAVEELNQSAKQPSSGSAMSISRPGSAKPSGLRMPSAKIGFFDGVKAGSKTPIGGSRSRSALPSSIPRSSAGICTPSGTANKTKLVNTAKITPRVATVATPELSRTDANQKSAANLEDHLTGLQQDSSAEIVDNFSNTSHKLLESVTRVSAAEANIEVVEVVDEGKHVADCGSIFLMKEESPEGKLHSAIDQASVDNVSKTSHEHLQHVSPLTAIEADSKAAEVDYEGKQVDDSGLDSLMKETSTEGTLHSAVYQASVDNISYSSHQHFESGSPSSIVGTNTKGSEELNEAKYVADSGSVSLMKETSPEGKSQLTNDEALITAKEGFNFVETADCAENLSASQSSEVGQINGSNHIHINNLNPSQEVGQSDDPRIVSIQACQGASGSVGHDGTIENQGSGHGTLEVTEHNGFAVKHVDGQDKHILENANCKMVIQRERYGNLQSRIVITSEVNPSSAYPSYHKQNEESTQLANLGPSLPCLGASPGTRTPFAVKNNEPDMIEACNSHQHQQVKQW